MTDEPPETAAPAPGRRRTADSPSMAAAAGVKAIPPVAPPEPGARIAIGIDVGGSGVKGAAVDLDTGKLVSTRHRVPTPQPSTPDAVVATISRLAKRVEKELALGREVPVGVGFPGVVLDGTVKTAANMDPGWTEYAAEEALRRRLKRHVTVVNDADAAGVAEMRFGAGRGELGSVFLITLGTGTGSALFWNGTLVPNLELGHMEIRGRDAEKRSASVARVRRGLSWKAWAQDLDEHLLAIEKLFWPNLFIVGGGVSKRADKFMPRLTTRAPIVPAQLLNDAGIVGSAVLAAEREAEATTDGGTGTSADPSTLAEPRETPAAAIGDRRTRGKASTEEGGSVAIEVPVTALVDRATIPG
jgi:polyphosphate glucokinase